MSTLIASTCVYEVVGMIKAYHFVNHKAESYLLWFLEMDEKNYIMTPIRSSRPEVFCKKGVLRIEISQKLTGKHLWQSHSCFPMNFTKFLRVSILLKNTSGGCFCPVTMILYKFDSKTNPHRN